MFGVGYREDYFSEDQKSLEEKYRKIYERVNHLKNRLSNSKKEQIELDERQKNVSDLFEKLQIEEIVFEDQSKMNVELSETLTTRIAENEERIKALNNFGEYLDNCITQVMAPYNYLRTIGNDIRAEASKLLSKVTFVAQECDVEISNEIKTKNALLKNEVAVLEEKCKKLVEALMEKVEILREFDPSLTDVAIRNQIKRNLTKSVRDAKRELAILEYNRRGKF
uniref:BAG domain-containing protein n=1 Tax=Parastrongyloides trichosuri TaxID=131310 RepID=A0A0N5A5C1_PARTI